MLCHQHKSSVREDVDSELLTGADADLVLTSASEMLDPQSNASGSAEVRAAAKVFKDLRAAFLATWKARVGEIPCEPYATQVLPEHILHLI